VFAHQTMELGGKTPVMVFDDFDVDQAVNYAAFGAFIGAGTDLRLRLAPYRAGLDLRRVRREAEGEDAKPSASAIPSIPQPSSAR
jgi:hypothetical protein